MEEVRVMPGLILWKDREINKLRRDMDRLIGRLWDDFGRWGPPGAFLGGGPVIDLSETEDSLLVEAEMPGIDPADLDVSVFEDMLTIKGGLQEEAVTRETAFSIGESRSVRFSRSIQLPCKVLTDEVQATLKDDLLRIVLPKCKEKLSRKVRIRVQ
jgi:HSP20 family protein